MAIKRIKQGRWERQAHVAKAGLMAGLGWASDHVLSLGMPAEERLSAQEAIARKQAEQWVRELGQLKGTIVKIGQILATYSDYFLPPSLADALHLLEADTEPMSWSIVESAIREAMGEKRTQLIIEPEPLAAASLSQVHRARIKQDYRNVCLKILYPGIADTLDSDIAVLGAGLRWWLPAENRPAFSDWLAAIKDVLREELDLAQEATKLKTWRQRLHQDTRYVIPDVIDQYTDGPVLCMSYEDGLSHHDTAVQSISQQRRNAIAMNMLELFLREVLLWGDMQTDPHPGNYRIRLSADGDQIVLLDFGSVRTIKPGLLAPLRQMLVAAYRQDREGLLAGIFDAGLLPATATPEVQDAFASVLEGLVEPLNYRARLASEPASIPGHALDREGHYCWAAARLPKRMAKQAMHSAFSKHFSFPGADFLMLSRKLAGVYAFIAALDARFDGSIVIERVLADMVAS